jgi:hypothetical protein
LRYRRFVEDNFSDHFRSPAVMEAGQSFPCTKAKSNLYAMLNKSGKPEFPAQSPLEKYNPPFAGGKYGLSAAAILAAVCHAAIR